MSNRRWPLLTAIAAALTIASAMSTVQAAPVAGSLYTLVDGKMTNLSWLSATGAASYEVYVNGTKAPVEISGGSTVDIALGRPLGPKDRVEVVALDSSGVRTDREAAAYWSNDYVRYQAATIYFSAGDSKLDSTDRAKIRAFASFIEQHGFTEVMVIGHDAGSSPSTSGYRMGQIRAQAVKAALRSQVDSTVTGSSWGNSWPAASNSSADGRAANRRVELYFR